MRQSVIALSAAAMLLLGSLVPAAAAASPSSESFSWTDHYTVDYGCGIVETVDVTVDGRAFFDADGSWQRDLVRFRYESLFEGPGGSLPNKVRQTAEYTPTSGTLRAQGIFIHGPQIGVAFPDVGRLVFDGATGSTLFATPRVLRLDDPDGFEALDAVLCYLIG